MTQPSVPTQPPETRICGAKIPPHLTNPRNLYNFPDTPEIFTSQRMEPRKSEVKAVQARQEYDHKTYDADTFPIQPPLSPAQPVAPTPPRRSAPSKSPEPRTPATPQSTPQRVTIGMYGNGAPRWGYVAKRTQGKEKAADPAKPTSSSMTGSSGSVMTTSQSSADQRHHERAPLLHRLLSLTALLSLHCTHCIALTALHSLHFTHCTSLIALLVC